MKNLLFICTLSIIAISSAHASLASKLSETQNYLEALKSGDCQIITDITTNMYGNEHLRINLLDRSNANEHTFLAEVSFPTMQISKLSKGQKFEYSDVTYQDTTFGLGRKEYQKLTIISDSQNRITSIQYSHSKDVSNWFGVKEKIIERFNCQDLNH